MSYPASFPVPLSSVATAADVLRVLSSPHGLAGLSDAERAAFETVVSVLQRQASEQILLARQVSAFVPGMGERVTYRPEQNLFTGSGYTSMAGKPISVRQLCRPVLPCGSTSGLDTRGFF